MLDFVPIQKRHKRSEFDCGNDELNQYLSRYARQNDAKGINKAFVATQPDEPLVIDGYNTISYSVIEFSSLPGDVAQKLPNYPVPSALIGRLAVDVSRQGEGLGTELLVNALGRIFKASSEIGIYAVRVDAIDEKADECGPHAGFPPRSTSFKKQSSSTLNMSLYHLRTIHYRCFCH